MRRHRHHRHLRGSRTRWTTPGGEWLAKARVERFVEPAVLLLLRERSMHGYELLDRVPELVGEERVDVGNLYRALRSLEEDGVVRSEWSAELPGPAKRTYELTDTGRQLLDAWADALRDNQTLVTQFLERYERR
jgi:PadR family transcriptional regulator, regulatory protein PadR